MQSEPPLPDSDRCLRCEYDLRGIADDQPCPECGLLAERSRRKTNTLMDVLPRWLTEVSTGLALVFLGSSAGVATFIHSTTWLADRTAAAQLGEIADRFGWSISAVYRSYFIVQLIVAASFVVGLFLFTAREPAKSNILSAKVRRLWVRALSFAPILYCVLYSFQNELRGLFPRTVYERDSYRWVITPETLSSYLQSAFIIIASILLLVVAWRNRRGRPVTLTAASTAVIVVGAIQIQLLLMLVKDPADLMLLLVASFGVAPLPMLVLHHLRDLMRRNVLIGLADDCVIAGYGLGFSILAASTLSAIANAIARVHGTRAAEDSLAVGLGEPIVFTSLILFGTWTLVSIARGVYAFRSSAMRQRRAWAVADRGLSDLPSPHP